jgi:PAS domain S-box-containing protein
MVTDKRLSQTMRIDLIPDVPVEPVKGKRVIVTPPTRKFHKVEVKVPGATQAPFGYQELLQSIYDAVLITDLSGRVVDANVRAIEFLFYERDELLNLSIFDIISGADESLLGTIWESLQNERHALLQAYCIRKDRSYFPAEIAVNKIRLGDIRLCFFVRDITVRRQQEEMLRTEHMAIQNAGNGIAIANMEAKLEYVNPAVARMWGYKHPDELIGVDARDLILNQEKAEEMVQTVLVERKLWMAQTQAKRNDNQGIFDVQISAACNINSDGETIGMVMSLVDISDQKRAEQAIREAERTRVMLESLGAACHHLGQPATVILANMGMLSAKLKDISDPMIRELIQSTLQASERLAEVLHKLNAANEYRTVCYIDDGGKSETPGSRIVDI